MQPLIIQSSELAQAMQLDLGERLAKKKFWLLIVAFFLIIAGCYLTWLSFSNLECSSEKSPASRFGAICLIIGFLIVLLPLLIRLFSKIVSRNCHKSGLFARVYNIQWDAQYLYITSKDAESKIIWSAFMRLVENDTLLLLYSHNRAYQLFPKRIFDSTQELDDFRQHALRGIENHESQ